MGLKQETRGSGSIGTALFGITRQAVLRLFFSHIDERFYQRQVLSLIGLGSGGVQRELERLTRVAILIRTVEGRQTYYQANCRCPVFEELHRLVRKTFGIADVLRDGLRPISSRIKVAFIYGSVAAGSENRGSDVDVMVVGDRLSLEVVATAFANTQTELRREVNPSVYPVEEFCRKLAGGHHFLSNVVASPKIFLIGDEDELTRLAQVGMVEDASHQPARNRRSADRRRSGHSSV